ncbi:DNA double-strand break repair ATPase Rad50 [Halovenus halobia]|uniref:DNA double-strand break repair ATPase Rad50 n=1 Tax=Halovenus halobia TaxID=3396622 RepID=UPI003F559B76
MRFDRIRLQNFKCYEETDVRLDAGVTVIHGLNGSGKSSLLEACFFALYGAKALDKTLDEIVTIGAEETVVELEFSHDGGQYQIRRRIRVSNGDARTAECVMDGPSGTTEGATDVRNRVAGLLRMDTDAFVNCAYVRQGEVNKLINASPSTRQDMIDDLLQLGKLEEYRERASDARLGVGRVRDDKQGALSELDDQIAQKEAKNLHEQRNELETELSSVTADIENYEENKQKAEQSREQAASIIEEYEEKRTELDELDEEMTTLREEIEATERAREELASEIDETRTSLTDATERRDSLVGHLDGLDTSPEALDSERVDADLSAVTDEIEELTEQIREASVEKQEADSDAENHREQAEQLDTDAREARAEAEELDAEIEETESFVETKREDLSEMAEEIEELRESFSEEPVEFGEAETHYESVTEELGECRETRAERQATLENERERLAEAEQLLEAGKCPECGQPVEQSPHVDSIGERRERVDELETELQELEERIENLESNRDAAEQLREREERIEDLEANRDNLEQLVDQRETTLEEKRERIETLREQADDAEAEAEQKREAATEAEQRATEQQEQIASYNQQKAELADRRERLETLSETLDQIERLSETAERLRDEREQKKSLNDERRERLSAKRDRRDELREEFDEDRIETAREEKAEAEDYIEKVTEALSDLESKQSTLQERLGAIGNELDQLEELRERREELTGTVEQLESLHDEAAELAEMYGTLRAQLRRQNVDNLERMLNETFDLVYENDTYARIELDGEYRLTVYQKDGEELDPDQLSGGERALFNLSLRCAIYRLLAEGIEGAAPMPPLILDEPTVFLDSGHVTQLVELIESMRERGVEQILVVSHDEELIDAADDLVTVTKDTTTNRSTVERGRLDERVVELS